MGYRKTYNKVYNYDSFGFGRKVQEYRLALDWTYTELSRRTKINTGTLSHVEQGQRYLPDEQRSLLVDKLIEGLRNSQLPSIGKDSNNLLKLAGFEAEAKILEEQVVDKTLTDEEQAENLSKQTKWMQAKDSWLHAAVVAMGNGDWPTWARCNVRAGVMALNLGQFDRAEKWFRLVAARSKDEVGVKAHAEAYIWLGWIFYYLAKFNEATEHVERGLYLLQEHGRQQFRLLGAVEDIALLVNECSKAENDLIESAWHIMGRACCDKGIDEQNNKIIQEGLTYLQKAYAFARKRDQAGTMGFELLRQVPADIYRGQGKRAKKLIDQSQELLGNRALVAGHIYQHKGLLAAVYNPRQARSLLEKALEGFSEPVFYAHGSANVMREIGNTALMEGKKDANRHGLNYAFIAAVLFPYGQNSVSLQEAACRNYHKDKKVFLKYLQELEESAYCMDAQPFSVFKQLLHSWGIEKGSYHLEMGIQQADKLIKEALRF